MKLVTVFATRNGARTLPAALAAHAALRSPGGGGKLIVVDNGSADATPRILAEAAHLHPALQLTVLRQPEPGKNRALNLALPFAAEADLVAFTDDDALPEPDWLERLAEAAGAAPRHGVFGGTITPVWMEAPPDWIFDWRVPLDICFAANASPAEGPVPAERVWGPNMAVRGALLRQGHRFDCAVGPDGTASYPMGSEVELTLRLERAGHPAWFAPRAVVRHLVRPEQMAVPWVLRRAYRCGLGAARVQNRKRSGPSAVPLPLLLRRWGYGAAAPLARRALPRGRLWFWLQWQALLLRGMTDGMRPPASAGNYLPAIETAP